MKRRRNKIFKYGCISLKIWISIWLEPRVMLTRKNIILSLKIKHTVKYNWIRWKSEIRIEWNTSLLNSVNWSDYFKTKYEDIQLKEKVFKILNSNTTKLVWSYFDLTNNFEFNSCTCVISTQRQNNNTCRSYQTNS